MMVRSAQAIVRRQVGNAIPVSNRHLDERIELRSDSDDRYRAYVVKQARPGFTKAKRNSRKRQRNLLRNSPSRILLLREVVVFVIVAFLDLSWACEDEFL